MLDMKKIRQNVEVVQKKLKNTWCGRGSFITLFGFR